MSNIEESKKDFIKIIELIKYADSNYIYKTNLNYDQILNSAISIIEKYNDTDIWFLKKYLNIFYFDNFKNIYITKDQLVSLKIFKIKHILKKYTLIEIIDLFIEELSFIAIKRKSLLDWILNNLDIFYSKLRGILFIVPDFVKNIKIPSTFELCSTGTEQFYFIICYYLHIYKTYNKNVINILLKDYNYKLNTE